MWDRSAPFIGVRMLPSDAHGVHEFAHDAGSDVRAHHRAGTITRV